MDALVLEAASAAWASLSALAILLLGVVTLAGGRTRAPGGLAFGGFAILWGLHILAGRWMAYLGPEAAAQAHLVYLALLLPLPYLLVQLARAFAREGARRARWRVATAGALALAVLCVGLLLLAPETLYEGPLARGERAAPAWGPLFAPLVMAPFYVALAVALVALDAARRASTTARTAMRHAVMTAGIALPVAFAVANNFAFYAADLLLDRAAQDAAFYAPLFLALCLAVSVVGARALLFARAEPSAPLRRATRLVGLAALAPLAWGFVEGVLAYELLPRFSTLGLWRLAGVALLAYAFARWRAPELTPRSRHTAATAMGIGGATAAGGLGVGLFLLVTPSTPLILLAGLGIPLVAITPSVRLARRALHVPREADLTTGTLGRRLETYRAALEASLARNSLRDDEDFLEALRERLAIGEDVHEALLVIARDTVLPPPDERHPGYERLRLLGEGGQGRAWLARRRADDELVVIKEPREQDDAARQALAAQARIAQRVRHPNLLHIQREVHMASATFLVMEHMPGGSLADQLARGPLPPALAARAALEALDGLGALHAAGIAHGDVKPSNVLLDAEGRARLADYGLACEAATADRTRTLAPGQGSLAAMAPELLEGGAPSPAADVYAAGALLYRLLTAEHYVRLAGLDEPRAREAVRSGAPNLPHPRVPPVLEPVLARALAKSSAARYPDARAMRAALAEAASGLEHEERRAG